MNNAISRLILIVFITLYPFSGGIAQIGERSPQKLPNPEALRFQQIYFKQPMAERVRLDNGIVLYIFEDHELPLVNVSVVIRTGSSYDPLGKEGLAELAGTATRTGGTKAQTGDAVDKSLDFLAATIHVSINRDSSSLNLSVLKKDFDKGFRILSQMITEPVFEEKKLALAKDLMIEDIKRIADDPQRLAFREFKRVLFGSNPAGRFPSAKSVADVTRTDIVEFHRRFFYPENIMISITGDVSKEEAIAKVRQYLGSWHISGKRPEIIPLPVRPKGKIYFFLKGTPQTIIICASIGPGKKEKA
ncbi:MAG TPA: pitrilysin family protein, partial [Syntrophales bacterium]|nr:pitrilysin family protein [Syntrophales bacterium]